MIQFVAPVNIEEDDVLIGAGSCVTGDVKKGELYLTRAKSKNYEVDIFINIFQVKIEVLNAIENKKILVAVTGSIAIYKTLELIRLYIKAGAK